MAENLKRKLYLYKDVDNGSVEPIIKEIHKINDQDDDRLNREPIELYINTFGGTIYDGLGLVNTIQMSKTPIHTTVNGYAMSMGLLIAAVGHKRFCHEHSTYMYHQGIAGSYGSIDHIKESHSEFERTMKIYDDILLRKIKPIKEKLDEIKKHKTAWYIAPDEAIDLGLVDKILK
jgi:ATP-dependent Clp protease protease subunit